MSFSIGTSELIKLMSINSCFLQSTWRRLFPRSCGGSQGLFWSLVFVHFFLTPHPSPERCGDSHSLWLSVTQSRPTAIEFVRKNSWLKYTGCCWSAVFFWTKLTNMTESRWWVDCLWQLARSSWAKREAEWHRKAEGECLLLVHNSYNNLRRSQWAEQSAMLIWWPRKRLASWYDIWKTAGFFFLFSSSCSLEKNCKSRLMGKISSLYRGCPNSEY